MRAVRTASLIVAAITLLVAAGCATAPETESTGVLFPEGCRQLGGQWVREGGGPGLRIEQHGCNHLSATASAGSATLELFAVFREPIPGLPQGDWSYRADSTQPGCVRHSEGFIVPLALDRIQLELREADRACGLGPEGAYRRR